MEIRSRLLIAKWGYGVPSPFKSLISVQLNGF